MGLLDRIFKKKADSVAVHGETLINEQQGSFCLLYTSDAADEL